MEPVSFLFDHYRSTIWKWLRMMIPFSQKTKALWNLKSNLEGIKYAIDEEDQQHFLHEIRTLYPGLEKYGMRMPPIEPVAIGDSEYDSTWQRYHLTFLKRLHRYGRTGDFSLHQWNEDVDRGANKRRRQLVATRQSQAPESVTWLDKVDAFLLIRGSTMVPNVP